MHRSRRIARSAFHTILSLTLAVLAATAPLPAARPVAAQSGPAVRPTLEFDKTAYQAQDCLALTLTDPSGRVVPQQTAQVTATVGAAAPGGGPGDEETLTLTGDGKGTFSSAQCLGVLPAQRTQGDGTLQVAAGDLLAAAVKNSQGNPAVFDFAQVGGGQGTGAVTIAIDGQILPQGLQSTASIPGEPDFPLAAVKNPDGSTAIFGADQLVLWDTGAEDLQAFLNRHPGAKSLRTLELPIAKAEQEPGGPATTRFHLIRLSASYLSTYDRAAMPGQIEDLADAPNSPVAQGAYTYSSELGARLSALILNEQLAGTIAYPHMLMVPQAAPVSDEGGGDTFTRAWFDPREASRGRVRAGQALTVLEAADLRARPQASVAIIDGGFAGPGDYTSGLDNPDYGRPFASIPQRNYDASGIVAPGDASGPNPLSCTGGNPCPWHGTAMFSVAAAELNNGFGAAGVGAAAAEPLFFKVGQPYVLSVAAAVVDAANLGADVINLSSGFPCRHVIDWCSPVDSFFGSLAVLALCNLARGLFPFLAGLPCEAVLGLAPAMNALGAAAAHAEGLNTVIVASAGNSPDNVDGVRYIPCTLANVVCVGALDSAGGNLVAAGFSGRGNGVDIWAPGTNLVTTPQPDSAGATDTSNGTSPAAAFISGVVALARTINPALTAPQVRDLLLAARCHPSNTARADGTTCTPSGDAVVNTSPGGSGGYIDVLDLVQRAGAANPRVAALAGCDAGWDELAAPADTPATAIALGTLTEGAPLTRSGNLSAHALPADEDWYSFVAPSVGGTASAELSVELSFAAAAGTLALEAFASPGGPGDRIGAAVADGAGRVALRGIFTGGRTYLVRVAAASPATTNDTCYGRTLTIRVVGAGVAGDAREANNSLGSASSLPVSAWRNVADVDEQIFARGVDLAPRASAERWELRLSDLTLHTAEDRDFFLVQLPSPGLASQGGLPDIEPRPGAAVPLPECDSSLTRTDSRGGSVNLLVEGSLVARIEPRSGGPASLPGEALRLYRSGVRVDETISTGTGLTRTVRCPRSDHSLGSFVVSFGERGGLRALLARYDLVLEYKIEVTRGVPGWLREVGQAGEVSRVGRMLCPGGGFPRCGLTPDAFGRIGFGVDHPPRFIPDCIADGPDCGDSFSYFDWPGGAFGFEMAASSNLAVQLLDANQQVIASAQVPGAGQQPLVGPAQSGTPLEVANLPPGLYVLKVSGPATRLDVAALLPANPADVGYVRVSLPLVRR